MGLKNTFAPLCVHLATLAAGAQASRVCIVQASCEGGGRCPRASTSTMTVGTLATPQEEREPEYLGNMDMGLVMGG